MSPSRPAVAPDPPEVGADGWARRRAAAMPPAERRAAIVAATIPLLIEHGAKVTTRQIAEAAGIAEGTIFRVFPDKDTLVEAAIETAFDPAPVDAAIAAIDLGLDLEARLRAAVAIIQRRVADIWRLMSAVGMTRPPGDGHRRPPVATALAELFEPDRARLRRDPLASAQLLRGLVFATSHPALSEEPMDPDEIVAVLLDGIRIPDGPDGADVPVAP